MEFILLCILAGVIILTVILTFVLLVKESLDR